MGRFPRQLPNGKSATSRPKFLCGTPKPAFSAAINAARQAADPGAPESSKAAIYNTLDPVQALATMETMTLEAVFVLKDFHRHMESPVVVWRLRDVGHEIFRESAHAHTYCAIHQHAARVGEPGGICRSAATRSAMVETNCRGNLQTSLEGPHFAVEARWKRFGRHGGEPSRPDRGGSRAGDFSDSGGALRPLSGDDHRRARGKKELLRHTGMLEFIDASDSMASIGGLDNLKGWLAQRRGAWEDAAREFGLEPPRGVIILGVQGCGKSMCARAIAGEWKLPLVKFDTAAVYEKYIGETEKKIQKVFQVAEGLAPCVLWIDELEKVFAGSGPDSVSVDAGVSSRILAAFLGWMQERKAPAFVAATCNVTALPPELIRKGRFDELFFVDLPNQSERKQIFAIQLNRRKRNPAEFDLDRVAAAGRGFSGAEIDAAVQTALYAAYTSKQPRTTQVR